MPSGVVKIGNKKKVWFHASPSKTMVQGGKSQAMYLNVYSALVFFFFKPWFSVPYSKIIWRVYTERRGRKLLRVAQGEDNDE